MPRIVEIKPSHTPSQLRRLAASTRDANQSRRLLSIAAVLDGMSRADEHLSPSSSRRRMLQWRRCLRRRLPMMRSPGLSAFMPRHFWKELRRQEYIEKLERSAFRLTHILSFGGNLRILGL